MKTTRLVTHFDGEQVVTIIGMIDELREALCDTYRDEIAAYQHQQRLQYQCNHQDGDEELDFFDDDIDDIDF